MSDSVAETFSAPALLRALNREVILTRRVLERLPDDRFDWQPHARSMTLGQLASHLAGLPGNVHDTFSTASYDLSTDGPEDATPSAPSRAAVLARFDAHAEAARTALATADAAALTYEWAMSYGEQVVFRQPRAQIVRELLLDHLIHHRGQLTVYLRLLDVPVPGLYGPTADEPEFNFDISE